MMDPFLIFQSFPSFALSPLSHALLHSLLYIDSDNFPLSVNTFLHFHPKLSFHHSAPTDTWCVQAVLSTSWLILVWRRNRLRVLTAGIMTFLCTLGTVNMETRRNQGRLDTSVFWHHLSLEISYNGFFYLKWSFLTIGALEWCLFKQLNVHN